MVSVATPTPVQVANDAQLFASTFLKILDKEKKLIPFRWNRAQADFHATRTGRDLILKARQLGFSTYVQGEMYRRTVTQTRTTITLSHDDETTQKLRIMSDRFWDNCKFNNIQPARKYANASMTTYPEFDSVATIGTAGNVKKGRGDTYTDFHGSEVAFWKDAESIVAGAMQGGNPDVILESTPNGAQGHFYELCMEAMRGDSVWTLHFYPWWWDDEYRIDPATTDSKFTDPEYTQEEQELADEQNLSFDQIVWRRYKKKELRDFFPQEYPEDPVTCFLTSGNSYFGDLTGVFTAPMNPAYDPTHDYAAGLDWGQSTDFTAMPVLDRTAKVQVDLLHINKMKWKLIRKRAAEMLLAWSHRKCNNGHITGIKLDDLQDKKDKCPECGSQDISYKFPRFAAEKNSIGSVNIEALMELGLSVQLFETNNETKADMMEGLYEGIHSNGWRLQDHPVQRGEMYNFVSKQLPSGIWRLAADGEGHDDTVIGLGIAHWVAVTPMQIF